MFNGLLVLSLILGAIIPRTVVAELKWITVNGTKVSIAILDTNASFEQAEKLCNKDGGNLATIVNSTYQKFIYDKIRTETESTYWIGLTNYFKDNVLQWTSGYPYITDAYFDGTPPNVHSLKDCYAINKTANMSNSWNRTDCSTPLPSVCMKDLPKVVKVDEPLRKGTCPAGFFRISNRCMKIVDSQDPIGVSWLTAKTNCEKLGTNGSSLASILNVDEQNTLTALMLNRKLDVWIGLRKLKDDLTKHVWSRGQKFEFTNWKRNEPNGYASSKINESCVMMYRRNTNPGKWNDQNCNSNMGYICENDLISASKGSKPLDDPLFPSESKDSKCKTNEHHYNGFCYWKGTSATSFTAAEKQCQKKKNGHLVSPHNLYETAYLYAFMSKHNVSSTMLGFQIKKATKLADAYTVSSADGVSTGFESLPGVSYDEALPCFVTSDSAKSSVKPTKCTLEKQEITSVCRYPLKNSPRHPENLNYTCDKGWKKGRSGRCLKLFDNAKSFSDASKVCVKNGGNLTSIKTVDEQQIITEMAGAALTSNGLWIGLNIWWEKSMSRYNMKWTDGSGVSFWHWRKDEPSKHEDENCVVIRHKSADWNNKKCTKELPFICSKPKKPAESPTTATPTVTTPETSTTEATTTPKPPTTSAKTTTAAATTPVTTAASTSTPTTVAPTTPTSTKAPVACPKGFNHTFFDKCYKVFNVPTSWDEANKICHHVGANVNLASVRDSLENGELVKLIKGEEKPGKGFWIGLSDRHGQEENQFTYWSDKTAMTIAFFDKNHTPDIRGNVDCVEIRGNGLWYPIHCQLKRKFICKYSTKKVPKHEPKVMYKHNQCLPGYSKYRNSCYKLFDDKPLNFHDADEKCKNVVDKKYRKRANLARISRYSDHQFLLSLMMPIMKRRAWIGLHYVENQFVWTDNYPVEFTKWPVNTSFTGPDTTCVTFGASMVTQFNAYWYARNCNEKYPFICQTPLISDTLPKPKLKCPTGYHPYELGGTCYKRFTKSKIFKEAQDICLEDNQKLNKNKIKSSISLLTIRSVYELGFIRSLLMASGEPSDNSFWLGMKFKKKNNVWKWTNGDPVNFTYTSGISSDATGCMKFPMHSTNGEYGMLVGSCEELHTVVCKWAPTLNVVKPPECLSAQGYAYMGHKASTKSGKSCVRWDMIKDHQIFYKLSVNIPGGSLSEASNFCRHPQMLGQKVPFCFTSTKLDPKTNSTPLEECDIPLCPQPAHGYVVVVAILVIVLLVTISFFVGVMLWRRTNTARGFIPYLRQHDPEGGTSFHNPIYTPAATC